jgi:hypothetical protein
MTFKKIRVRVNPRDHALAQQELFRMGYKWCVTGTELVHDNFTYLFGEDDGYITYSMSLATYDKHTDHEEYAIIDGELKPFKPQPLDVTLAVLKKWDDEGMPEQRSGEDRRVGINPKQGAGSVQLPMTLPSPLFRAHITLAKLNGKGKYGGANFIGTNVLMSTYLDAIQRHFDKILMGEEFDEVDGVSHWGAIGAGIDIILTARAAGTLDDDRLRADGQLEAYKALTPMVKKLQELHKDKKPYHYLMANREKDTEAAKKSLQATQQP